MPCLQRAAWSKDKMELNKTVTIDVSTAMSLEDIINKIATKKIIYIGEVHDQYAHHLVQLDIINAIHKKNPRITIAMEMFARTYQPIIDNYINGEINEKEFLKESRYFKTWGFNYYLYRDIILFAKTNNIPIIALNIERAIINKVSKSGLASLTDEEKELIPNDLDLSNIEYSKRLKEIFLEHPNKDEKRFDFFFESQILWDEYMAESISAYIEDYIDRQIIVLAGNGHLEYGSGIPSRVKRLNNINYALILNDTSIQRNIADYVLFPISMDPVEAPKLMVTLTEENGKVKIEKLLSESIFKKAGIQKGDIILSIDDTQINTIDDINVFLFFSKSGDKIKVRIQREKNINIDILVTLKI
jgi:uncharacterized iron-regulated protein